MGQFIFEDSNEGLEDAFPLIYETILKYDSDYQDTADLLISIFSDMQETLSKEKLRRLAELLEEKRSLLSEVNESNFETYEENPNLLSLNVSLLYMQVVCYRNSGDKELMSEKYNLWGELTYTFMQMLKEHTS